MYPISSVIRCSLIAFISTLSIVSCRTPQGASEGKDLEFELAFTYFVAPTHRGCIDEIKNTFREFPTLSNISLKQVQDASNADIKFVDYSGTKEPFRFEDDGTFSIGVAKEYCDGGERGENNVFYPPIAMAMRLIREQGNLKFAQGKCGRRSSLPYFQGSPDPSDAPRLWMVHTGNPGVASDDDDMITSAVSFVNLSRDLSIQLTYDSSKANIFLDFKRYGKEGTLSVATFTTLNDRPVVYSAINKDRLKSAGDLWDKVYHETEWQLYQIESHECHRFKWDM